MIDARQHTVHDCRDAIVRHLALDHGGRWVRAHEVARWLRAHGWSSAQVAADLRALVEDGRILFRNEHETLRTTGYGRAYRAAPEGSR